MTITTVERSDTREKRKNHAKADVIDALVDWLTDAMDLCDKADMNFEAILRTAEGHYQSEKQAKIKRAN